MKRGAPLATLLAFLVLVLPSLASAHDGWVEAHPTVAETGQPLSLFLLYGNHSNNHRSYRLAAKWDPRYARLIVIDPGGREHHLTAQMVDLGEDAEAIRPKGMKG